MCRLAGYVGSAVLPLSALVYDPPHSLEHAAYAPRELISGTINVDGTGVAWWPPDRAEPLRYAVAAPPWADPNLMTLAADLHGHTILAAVRSATPGLSFGLDHVAPFVGDGLAGVHNGWIGGFRGGIGRTLLEGLDAERFGRLVAMNDSLALVLLVAQHLDDNRSATLADAVESVIDHVAEIVAASGEAATLNLVMAASGAIVAARTSVGSAVNSLYTRSTAGSWVASEPLDDGEGWIAVPEHSLAILTEGDVVVRPLDHVGTSR